MKSVLVTGARGALGQALVSRLKQQSATTQILLTSHTHHGADYISLDVSDREQVKSVIKATTPDLVIHLAASLSDNFEQAYAINVEAARHLCDAVLATGHPTRLVVIGSAAEYGVVQANENPIKENHLLAPVTLYGMTKAWQTLLAQQYAFSGVDIVVARIFNLDGPGMSERLFVGRIQKQIANILAGQQQLLEIGPLTAIRDYISTTDAAELLLAIAERGKTGHIYHVASGKRISMRELLGTYLQRNGLDFSCVLENVGLSNHKGYDVPVIVANMSQSLALLPGKS